MDNIKLKNNKYFKGKYTEKGDYKGWFVGSFFNDGDHRKTEKIEILYKEHNEGEQEKSHYHKEKIELLIILEGKAKYSINGEDIILEDGEFLFVDINNIIKGEFLKKSKIFAIHSPSIPSDKILIE